jgi:hypothetical protein
MENRVFTKDILKSVNTMALVQGYNRSVNKEFLDSLPDDKVFVPRYTLLHEHKAGKPCDPHVRCVFEHESDWFIIDVEMGCWEMTVTVSDALELARHATASRAEIVGVETE